MADIERATLYVVATPIGNINDMVPRACQILNKVSLVLAEDTRHSGPLLKHFGISTPLLSFHEFSSEAKVKQLTKRLKQGESMALISDSGTPLISDPGYQLVDSALQADIAVLPVPGPSALTAALSVAGIPTDRFVFEGFLPSRSTARRKTLRSLQEEQRTMVFFEAPHRLHKCLEDMAVAFGRSRTVTIARELTKLHQNVKRTTIDALLSLLDNDQWLSRGEIVLVVAGARPSPATVDSQTQKILSTLLETMSPSQAATLTHRITGVKRRELYQLALQHNDNELL